MKGMSRDHSQTRYAQRSGGVSSSNAAVRRGKGIAARKLSGRARSIARVAPILDSAPMLSTCTPRTPARQDDSGLIPLFRADAGLAENLFEESFADVAGLMRVGNPHLQFIFLHKLVTLACHWPGETELAELADQFASGDGARHGSGRFRA